MSAMTYEEALSELERAARRGMRLGLGRVRALCARLGDPQAGRPGILVAGTNGKGSVCAISDAILRAAGHRVLRLTKPHLTSYRERICVGGDPVSEDVFADLIARTAAAGTGLAASVGAPTHHELITAAGFLAAATFDVEAIVCEVGLGGRLDATNIYDGGVAVISTIGLDHQAQLGTTLEAIAVEKAAIIKPGNDVVTGCSGPALAEVRAAAERVGATVLALGEQLTVDAEGPGTDGPRRIAVATAAERWTDLTLTLVGDIQLTNAALAVGAATCLGRRGLAVPEAAVRAGVRDARWPGRLQLVGTAPPVLVDGGHNPHAIEAILPDLRRLAAGRPVTLCFGTMGDKDHRAMLGALAGLVPRHVVLTRAQSERAADPDALAAEWAEVVGVGEEPVLIEDVPRAVERARSLAGAEGLVIACGSIYVAGEALAALGQGLPPDPVPAAATAGR